MTGAGGGRGASVVWHDVECGGYAVDLALWIALADEGSGPILDLGCGTGRVALGLARNGHRVMGLDADASLAEEFNRRAGELPAVARVGDAAGFSLEREFGLALAPMQLVQLLADAEERVACLRCTAAHLRPGGLLAAAIVDDIPSAGATARECAPPLPDARELDGWVYSSLPLETVVDGETIVVRRLRQVVSPGGGLSEELSEVDLRMLTAAQLESEAAAAGLRPGGRLEIPATDAHVGSNVVLLEKES